MLKFKLSKRSISIILVLFASLIFQGYSFANQTAITSQEGLEYVSGEVIIKLKVRENQETFSVKSYSERMPTQEDTLSELKNKYNLRDERPVFKK